MKPTIVALFLRFLRLARAQSGRLGVLLASAVYGFAAIASAQFPGMEARATVSSEKLLSYGDFDGDGATDTLVLPLTGAASPGLYFAQIVDEPDDPMHLSWQPGLFGLTWQAADHYPIVADFNGDGRDDVLLQSQSDGASHVLLANASSPPFTYSELLGPTALTNMSHRASRALVADFNGDGRSDLLLQPRQADGEMSVLWSDSAGLLQRDGSPHTLSSRAFDVDWSGKSSELYVGNFNGQDDDGLFRDDVLIRKVRGDRPFQQLVVLTDTDGVPSILAQQRQTDDETSPWADPEFELTVADFLNEGIDSVLLHHRSGQGPGYLGRFDTAGQLAGGLERVSERRVKALLRDNAQRPASQYALTEQATESQARTQSGAPANRAKTANTRNANEPAVTAVGDVEGQAGVNDGVAVYNLPIVVPPGRAGLQPELALNYSHQAVGAVMGRGWSVSGLPSISRCSATVAQDGAAFAANGLGGVAFAPTDQLCLDGQRLKLHSGTHLANGARYRTEFESGIQVETRFANGQLFEFEVRTANNQIMIFGGSEGTVLRRFGDTGNTSQPVLEWKLANVSDYYGNYVKYDYLPVEKTVPGQSGARRVELLIDTISYSLQSSGGSLVSGGQTVRSVSFDYDDRSALGFTPSDGFAYVAGTRLESNKLLSAVTTRLGAERIREYRVFYHPVSGAVASNVPRVKSIYECSWEPGETNEACLAPTTFDWSGGYTGSTLTNLGTQVAPGQPSSISDSAIPIDFDGDGQLDFVEATVINGGSVQALGIWRRNAQGLFERTDSPLGGNLSFNSFFRTGSFQTDFDNDGDLEFIVPGGDGSFTPEPPAVPADLALWSPGGTGFEVPFLNFGLSWSYSGEPPAAFQFGYREFSSSGTILLANRIENGSVREGTFSLNYPGTPNGPGGHDIFVQACDSNSNCSAWSDPLPVFFECNTQQCLPDFGPAGDRPAPKDSRAQSCGVPQTNSQRTLRVVSFDGAAIDSVIDTGIPVQFLQFATDGQSNFLTGDAYHVLDATGDGRQDLVVRDSNHWRLYTRNAANSANPNGFTLNPTWCPDAQQDAQAYVIEYDGDGRADLLVTRRTADPIIYKSNSASGFSAISPGIEYTPRRRYELLGFDTFRWEPEMPPIVADFNGDGLTDIVYPRHEGNTVVPQGKFDFYQNSGDGFIELTTNVDIPFSFGQQTGYYVRPYDADGDGDLDLLMPNSGTPDVDGFGPCIQFEFTQNCTTPGLLSLNDGHTWRAVLFDGTSFSGEIPNVAQLTLNGLQVLDIDSDGDADILGEAHGAPGEVPNEPWPALTLNNGGAKHLLTRVTRGAGYFDRVTEFDYKPLIDGNGMYTLDPAAAGSPTSKPFASSLHFVSQMRTSSGDGSAQLNAHNYHYNTARYETTGFGFSGFASVRADDLTAQLSTVTEYHQDFPLAGQPISSKVQKINAPGSYGVVLRSTDFGDYQNVAGTGSTPNYLRYPRTVTRQIFDPDTGAPLSQFVREVTAVTEFGSTEVATNTTSRWSGSAWQALRESTTTNQFGQFLGQWWIDRPEDASTVAWADSDDAYLSGKPGWAGGRNTQSRTTTNTYAGVSRDPRSVGMDLADPMMASVTNVQRNAYGSRTYLALDEGAGALPAHQIASRAQRWVFNSENDYFPSAHRMADQAARDVALEFDPRSGRRVRERDANLSAPNWSVSLELDGFGRTRSTKHATAATEFFNYEWVSAAQINADVCPATTVFRLVLTQAGAGSSYTCFDKWYRELRTATTGFDGLFNYSDRQYNATGEAFLISEVYDAEGLAFANGHTHVTYDEFGRVHVQQRPNGSTVTLSYDGLTATSTLTNVAADDPACNVQAQNGSIDCTLVSSSTWDAAGFLVNTVDAIGGQTSYVYDAFGSLALVTDANGKRIFNQYDGRGRRLSSEDPSTGITTYVHNVADEVVKATQLPVAGSGDAQRDTYYDYDGLGRVYRVREGLSGSTRTIGQWFYDGPSGTLSAPYIGRLFSSKGDGTYAAAVGDADRSVSYDYYPSGPIKEKITSTTVPLVVPAKTAVTRESYTYVGLNASGVGSVARAGYPDTVTYSDNVLNQSTRVHKEYQYNAHGYQTAILAGQDGGPVERVVSVSSRNARGQIETREFGPSVGAIEQKMRYNPRSGRVATICASTSNAACNASGAGGDLQQLQYFYNRFSNLRRVDNVLQQRDQILHHIDKLGRLKRLRTARVGQPEEVVNLAYDAVGNILSHTEHGNYLYQNAARPYAVTQVTSINDGQANYSYDSFGNQIGATGSVNRLVGYSFGNLPTQITSQGVTTSYRYDGAGQRTSQVVDAPSGADSVRIYDGDTEVVFSVLGGDVREARIKTRISDVAIVLSRDSVGDGTVDNPNADTDNDGIADGSDLCRLLPNDSSIAGFTLDADGDGIGNYCDGDINNDGAVNFLDASGFTANFGTSDPVHDLNGDGVVNFLDLAHFSNNLWNQPLDPGVIVVLPNQYLLSDSLGSVETVVDSAGNVLGRYAYEAYGLRSGDPAVAAAGDLTQGFTGHEHIADQSGLVHMRGRLYDPQLGRFMSVDPVIPSLTNSQSYGVYSYVNNRPFDATDPTGLSPADVYPLVPDVVIIRPSDIAFGQGGLTLAQAAEYMLRRSFDFNASRAYVSGSGGPGSNSLNGATGMSAAADTNTVDLGFLSASQVAQTSSVYSAFVESFNADSIGTGRTLRAILKNHRGLDLTLQEIIEFQNLYQYARELYREINGVSFENGEAQSNIGDAGAKIGRSVRSLAIRGFNPLSYPVHVLGSGLVEDHVRLVISRVLGDRAPSSRQGAGRIARLNVDLDSVSSAQAALSVEGRSIGSAAKDRALQQLLDQLPATVSDVRVDQEQVNSLGIQVGRNRPNLQFTLYDIRFYVNFAGAFDVNAPLDTARAAANDPNGVFISVDVSQ